MEGQPASNAINPLPAQKEKGRSYRSLLISASLVLPDNMQEGDRVALLLVQRFLDRQEMPAGRDSQTLASAPAIEQGPS